MIKKVKTGQLKPGMYIHDFDCGWLEIPFLRRSVALKDELMIDKIVKHGIREVYIDTDRGLDVSDAPTSLEVKQTLNAEVERLMHEAGPDTAFTEYAEELERAKSIRKEAQAVVTCVMRDIRDGKRIDLEQVGHTVNQMTDSVFGNINAMMCLSRLKMRDEYTFMHSVNVCILMLAFARFMGFDREACNEVGVGALLHDVGKMRVPDEVLNKAARLTEEEFELMRSHVNHSFQILHETVGIPDTAITVAFEHHERHDGTGYPLRLKGEEISRIGQMSAIVDVYDAITSDRCYHKGIDPTEALRKIYEWSEHHFNRDLTQQFIKCVGIYPPGTMVRLESGYLAVVVAPSETSATKPLVRLVYDTRKDRRMPPRDLALAEPAASDRIVGYESPHKWGINPLEVMNIL